MRWRRRAQSDFEAEIRAHLKLEEDRLREQGLSETEARHAAQFAFGNRTSAAERFYESARWLWWDNLRKDLGYAWRTLRRGPAFAVAAVLTLALGIGANTAIFSVIDAVLVRPLPYPDSNRLVMLYQRNDAGDSQALSPADFLEYRRQRHLFEPLSAFRDMPFNLSGGEGAERVAGAVVTPDFFVAFRTPALLGRALSPDRDKPGDSRVVVLSYALWQRRFGGDRRVVGKPIVVDGAPAEVVGVMPGSFQFPVGSEIWASARYAVPEHPLHPADNPSNLRDSHYFEAVGRLAPGVTLKRAQAESDALARRLKKQYGDDEEGVGADLVTLRDDLVDATRSALLILLGAVALLLLIACVNVINVLLARGASRRKEFAIRGALGAGRGRIVRQLLAESALLAAAGGGLGAALAYWTLPALRTLAPANMLAGQPIEMDTGVLLFTALVSATTGILCGLFPAIHIANPDIAGMLNEGGRGSASGLRAAGTRNALVVSEIALAAVLLVSAGLLLRSFDRLLAAPKGFRPERILSLQLSLSPTRYPNAPARAGFVRQLIERINAVPGVLSTAAISRLPLNPGNSTRSVEIQGRTSPPSADVTPDFLVATPGFFPSMGIPIVRGRDFTPRDTGTAPTVAIVNEAMARYFWPAQDPIGKLIKVGVQENWSPVVGVVSNIRQHHLDQAPRPAVYVPYEQDTWPFMAFVVRTGMEPAAAVSAVRAAVRSVDKDQPIYNVRTMDEVVSASLASKRLSMVLLGLFALVAVALACIGIYGVMAYAVAERTHEIGVRMALGAKSGAVLRLVVVHGLRLAFVGIAAGLILSLAAARLLSRLLYGVSPWDPLTFAGIALLLVSMAAVASLIPARRAVQVDPVIALRIE